jgi:hypothetical protein
VELGGPPAGPARPPTRALTGATESTMASNSTESRVLAADSPTAKGTPPRSTNR